MLGNLDVRGPDFMGHDIVWTDPDGEGFRLEIHMSEKPASELHRQRWSYKLWDIGYDEWPYSVAGLDTGIPQMTGLPSEQPPVFEGDDFETAYGEDEDIVRNLLGFLSLNDGDTDSEYFDNYTERQIAWRDERAETLSLYAMDEEE